MLKAIAAVMLFATVVYDDEAVQKLLDRDQEGEAEKEREFGMNEYLRSFKVASYQVKEGIDEVRYGLQHVNHVLSCLKSIVGCYQLKGI